MDPFCKVCNDAGCWCCGTLVAQRLRQLTRESFGGEEDLSGFLRSIGWEGTLSGNEREMVLRAIRWGIAVERGRRLVEAPAETRDELARFGMLDLDEVA